MLPVSYEFVQVLATEFGAVECAWRESDQSFTGFVAEVWFSELPSEFSTRWAAVVGYSILVRGVSSGPGSFAASIPCTVPSGQASLGPASRGSRVQLRG
ncbi:hypothetical protein VB780_08430 [Leptolyngbya sp. CCNP1308]|uniref:hypothetical protein n=1 Tax=Leptolyngbya sp. CCNP1308 TaxID=3110255 RepID=UPI002B1FF7D0|nr:hypothetical protein [Leptolyngbya sp. CCNP1308]MEA5448587.1 hypothetical protein [Leptolyngbya sp. CCNP1308]